MKNRGYLQISFAWMFAIIAGVFIIFLAIFAVTKFTSTEQIATDTATGKEFGILLNALETGFETGKTTSITMPVETRVYNRCNNEGYFGRQIIQLSQKSFSKWPEPGLGIGFSNKYIFSDSIVEGRNFFVFVKPFDFPFKVADLIYITSSEKSYCFLNPPERIEEELSNLDQGNIFLTDCPDNSIRVCFEAEPGFPTSNCDINVNQNIKSVEKRGETMYFETDSLMYAAIFADKETYECQLKRLMQRTEQLSSIYNEKSSLISNQGCPIEINLFSLSTAASSFTDSAALITVNRIAEDLDERNNDLTTCKLW